MSLKDVGHVSEAIELEREALCIRKLYMKMIQLVGIKSIQLVYQI